MFALASCLLQQVVCRIFTTWTSAHRPDQVKEVLAMVLVGSAWDAGRPCCLLLQDPNIPGTELLLQRCFKSARAHVTEAGQAVVAASNPEARGPQLPQALIGGSLSAFAIAAAPTP